MSDKAKYINKLCASHNSNDAVCFVHLSKKIMMACMIRACHDINSVVWICTGWWIESLQIWIIRKSFGDKNLNVSRSINPSIVLL